ncbi:MAG: TonB-dependent receptor domain-containing protein [Opitutales bacterium]
MKVHRIQLWPALCFAFSVLASQLSAQTIELLTAENTVERSIDGERWVAAEAGASLPKGSWVRTGEYSRATLQFPSGNLVRLGEFATLQLIPAEDEATEKDAPLDLQRGALYFFSRDRDAESNVETPTANAAIRGTEFEVRIREDGSTQLVLFDGEVALSNDAATATLRSGQIGVAAPGAEPEVRPLLDASQFIQWYLYYPAVITLSELQPRGLENFAAIREAYLAGDLLSALAAAEDAQAPVGSDAGVLLAQLRLATGHVEAAEALLGRRQDGPAQALREVIAVVRGQPITSAEPPKGASHWLARSYSLQANGRLDAAREAAKAATELAHDFGYAWVRLAQLHFSFADYAAMGTALERADALSPSNPIAFVLRGFRSAAANSPKEARTAFERAIALDPSVAEAWLGRGLIEFQQGNEARGLRYVQAAAALEPTRSLLRSYLGKAFAEQDFFARFDLGEARAPENFRKAAAELELAKDLDPADPTPWLYNSLLLRATNRYNEAVGELQQSLERNDNRSLFRSRLLLDEDVAVRRANLANIYRLAGLEEQAFSEAGKAVTADYTNFSAHIFLRGAYEELLDPLGLRRRFETAWANEWFLGNMLSPLGAGIVAQTITNQEYTALFTDKGYEGAVTGTVDSRERFSASVFQAYRWDKFSVGVELQREEWAELYINDAFEETLALVHLKFEPTLQDRFYTLIIYDEIETGSRAIVPRPATAIRDRRSFQIVDGITVLDNPAVFEGLPEDSTFGIDPEFEFERWQEPLLFNTYHREWNPRHTTLLLYGFANTRQKTRDPISPRTLIVNTTDRITHSTSQYTRRSQMLHSGEAQHVFQHANGQLIAGARIQFSDIERSASIRATQADINLPPSPFPTPFPVGIDAIAGNQFVDQGFDRQAIYAYYLHDVTPELSLIGSLTFDRMHVPDGILNLPLSNAERTESQVSPKAGIVWTPTTQLTLRGYIGRGMSGFGIEDQLRLEPSQVAGHVSAYTSLIPSGLAPGTIPGATIDSLAVTGDYHLDHQTFFNLSGFAGRSNGERTSNLFEATTNVPREADQISISDATESVDYVEYSVSGGISHLLTSEITLGFEGSWQHAEVDQQFDRFGDALGAALLNDTSADLYRAIASAQYQHPRGWFVQGDAQLWHQDNHDLNPDLPDTVFPQLNLEFGYRLPKQHGVVSVGLLNLTDEDPDLSPVNFFFRPPLQRTLVISARFGF